MCQKRKLKAWNAYFVFCYIVRKGVLNCFDMPVNQRLLSSVLGECWRRLPCHLKAKCKGVADKMKLGCKLPSVCCNLLQKKARKADAQIHVLKCGSKMSCPTVYLPPPKYIRKKLREHVLFHINDFLETMNRHT